MTAKPLFGVIQAQAGSEQFSWPFFQKRTFRWPGIGHFLDLADGLEPVFCPDILTGPGKAGSHLPDIHAFG
jgi:hypothetical protein